MPARSDSKPYVVLGIRRRSLADLRGYDMHARRSGGERRHIDASRSHLNRALLGDIAGAHDAAAFVADELALQHIQQKIAGLKKRRRTKELRALNALAQARGPRAAAGDPWDHKNTEPFFDGLLSASASFFAAGDASRSDGDTDPDADADAATVANKPLTFEDSCRRRGWNPETVESWIASAEAFLRQTFADDLLAMRVDLDETTPHIHFVGAPRALDGKGRTILSQRQHRVLGEAPEFEGDKRTSYERLFDRAAEHFEPLGLVRGRRTAAEKRAHEALGQEAAAAARETPLSPEDGRRLALRIAGEVEATRRAAERENAAATTARSVNA
jgi:hypothetical protein